MPILRTRRQVLKLAPIVPAVMFTPTVPSATHPGIASCWNAVLVVGGRLPTPTSPLLYLKTRKGGSQERYAPYAVLISFAMSGSARGLGSLAG